MQSLIGITTFGTMPLSQEFGEFAIEFLVIWPLKTGQMNENQQESVAVRNGLLINPA